MKCVSTLSEGYREILSVDLQKDKKLALLINLLSLGIAAVTALPAVFMVPISTLFDMSKGIGPYLLRFAVLLILMVAYILLHESVHGITMKLLGCKKVTYGFTGLYAYAGCNDYFDRPGYITVALSPVVVWGLVLTLVLPFVSAEWFWVVYLIQVFNLSGAAGDFYVTARFARLPNDILVKDTGVSMSVYSTK